MYFDHSATTPVHPDVQNLINITQKKYMGTLHLLTPQGKSSYIIRKS